MDLARQALLAAREAAKKNGTTKKPKRRTGTTVRRGGREPLGLGVAIGMMMAERGMVAPAAGGSVLAQFDAILAVAVLELDGRVQAVAFDADTGPPGRRPRCPGSWYEAALERTELTAARRPGPAFSSPVAPVERRTLPDGYRRTVEAHRQVASPSWCIVMPGCLRGACAGLWSANPVSPLFEFDYLTVERTKIYGD